MLAFFNWNKSKDLESFTNDINSLYQEVPCAEWSVQTVTLVAGNAW